MDNTTINFQSEDVTNIYSNFTSTESVKSLLESRLGPQGKNLIYVIILLLIYGLIFISGIVGNVCTCLVILKNNSLKTTTNYYLLSLALSDVLILLLGKSLYKNNSVGSRGGQGVRSTPPPRPILKKNPMEMK